MKMLPIISAALIALFLAGCEGDAIPFEEAVEIREQSIVTVNVVPPASTVEELILNIDQAVQFGVEGVNTSNQTVKLSAGNRQWLVSDASVARIDRGGRLVALSNGSVEVSVEIGGLLSKSFQLSVFDSELSAMESIVGDELIERCLPADYRARGLYGDGKLRDLTDVTWSLATADSDKVAIVNRPDISGTTLTGLNPGVVTLTASAGGFSVPLQVVISDSLTSLAITPESVTMDLNEKRNFVATGTYAGAGTDETSRQVAISSAVEWEIVTGLKEATVSNKDDTRGQVTGVASGIATLQASCGNLSASTPASITIKNADKIASLSFNRASPVILAPGSRGLLLEVSTGATYSRVNKLDNDDLEWEFIGSGNADAIELTRNGDNAGFIKPNSLVTNGVGTVTVTHPDGTSASIEIEVKGS